MKALFITCSLIAILYLGYQSQIWQYMNPNHELANHNDISIPTDSPLNNASSAIFASEDSSEIVALNERIDALNGKIDTLELALQQNLREQHTANRSSSKIGQAEGHAPSIENETSELTQGPSVNDQASNEQLKSEQIKRLNQQALLRDLSQKLELSALSSLSN